VDLGIDDRHRGVSSVLGGFAVLQQVAPVASRTGRARCVLDSSASSLLIPLARTLKLKLVKIEVAYAADLSVAFETALREKANALFVLPDEPVFLSRRARIVDLAAKFRLPAFYGAREFVDDGGLMSYGENLRTAYRNAALYVNNLARGAKPADLPVGQPTKFELVVNLKTASTLGITIPQSVLARADDVIQ
jgi:putative tryptophan/tyrosine transport system substrate-binding protein